MKVLSLFDGMSCGMLAMIEAGQHIDRYVAYEIDKYAIQTSKHNFPMIEQRGDVFNADFTEFEGFDWLIGGSPCTYWSIAQKNNRETEASGMGWELFSQYVRALHEAKPKYFIYENNKSMSKQIRASIDKAFGFEAVYINSALVSAQNRQRLYWVGKRNEDGTYSKVDVQQPEDRGILLKDILQTGADLTNNDNAYCLTASYNGACAWNTIERNQRTMVSEPVRVGSLPRPNGELSTSQGMRIYDVEGKSVNITAQSGGIGGKTGLYAIPVNTAINEKSHTPKAQYYKNGLANFITNNGFDATAVAEPCDPRGREKARTLTAGYATTSERDLRKDIETDGFMGRQGVAQPVYIGAVPENNGTCLNGKQPSQQYRIYDTNAKGVAVTTCAITNVAEPIMCAIQKDEPMRIKEATKQGYTDINLGNCVDMTQPNSKTRRGRNMADKSNCCMTSCQHYQYCGQLGYATPIEWDEDGRPTKAISCAGGKAYTVYEVKDGKITTKGKTYPIKLVDGFYIIRKLTVLECMRLQRVPEWYEFPVSDSQAYKMLGNGWTVQVISHLIEACLGGSL